MCMGFGCNAAGVVGCRIIDSPRERMLAIITNSLVPCNGRFPAIIAIISMFFVTVQGFMGSVLSALWLTGVILLGVVVTFLATKLLSGTLFRGMPSSYTLEMPPYRPPQIGSVIIRSVFDRTLKILGRAVLVAVPAGIIIWLCSYFSFGGKTVLEISASALDPFARLFGLDGNVLCGFILSPVCNAVDRVFTEGKEVLYEDCLRDLFGNLTGIWTFVPNEYYEQAKDYMLDETENAELIKKLDAYHYGVMDSTQEILDEAMEDGMKLAIISNYGKAAVPVLTNDSYQSDFLIDTARTSLGATCADYGETLGEGYIQKNADGHNHLSCDNVIDASTCIYPEYTWFVKDMMHTWYSIGYYHFTWWLAQSASQPTVNDTEEYPQFLLNNQETDTLDPLTPENCETQSTDVDLTAVFQNIFSKSN